MYKLCTVFYLLLIGFQAKSQITSSESTENEISIETSSNNESLSSNSDVNITDEPSTTIYTTMEFSDSTDQTETSTAEGTTSVSTSTFTETELQTIITTISTDQTETPTAEGTTSISTSTCTETELQTITTTISNEPTETITENTVQAPNMTHSISTTNIKPNSPNITISLPTSTASNTVLENNATHATSMCKENEVYSCLPWCPRTCNSPLSQIICLQVPSYNRLCRRGCTCKRGYLLEKTTGKCLNKCPAKQPL